MNQSEQFEPSQAETEARRGSGRMNTYDLLPSHLRAGMLRYVEHGIETGSFLRAVLENDLREAFLRASTTFSIAEWHGIVRFLDGLPHEVWGSPEKVNAWIAKHKRQLGETSTGSSGQ